MRAVAILPLVAVLALAAPARAERCHAAAVAWSTVGGTLVDDARCEGVVLTADGDGRTEAVTNLREELDGDGAFAFRWQRLSADVGTMQARFPGGVVMFRDGEVGLYIDEASWQAHGFAPLPGALAQRQEVDATDVRITLAGDDVTVTFDGVEVLHEAIPGRIRRGMLALSVHGALGARSRMHITGAEVRGKRPAASRAPRRAGSRTRGASRR